MSGFPETFDNFSVKLQAVFFKQFLVGRKLGFSSRVIADGVYYRAAR